MHHDAVQLDVEGNNTYTIYVVHIVSALLVRPYAPPMCDKHIYIIYNLVLHVAGWL